MLVVQFCTASGLPVVVVTKLRPRMEADTLPQYIPAAIMWKIHGSLCSPTEFRLKHMSVPYSNVRVGVKVSKLVEPFDRMKGLPTSLASAELLKVHLV